MIETLDSSDLLRTFFTELEPQIQHSFQESLHQSSTSYTHLSSSQQQTLARQMTQALTEAVPQSSTAALLQALTQHVDRLHDDDITTAIDLLRHSAIVALKDSARRDSERAVDLFEPLCAFFARLTSEHTAAQLHDAEREAAEQRSLNELMHALIGVDSLDELVPILVRYVEPLDAANCNLFIYEPDEHGTPVWGKLQASWQRNGVSPVRDRYYLPDMPLSKLTQTAQIIAIEDATSDPLLDDVSRNVMRATGSRALLSAPIVLHERVLGRIWIAWPEMRHFSSYERQIFDAVAAQAPIVAERARLIDELQHRIGELDTLRNALETQVQDKTRSLRIYKTLVDNAIDAIAITDLNGVFTYANNAYQHMTGFGEQVLGSNFADYFDPERSKRISHGLMPFIIQSRQWQGNVTMRRPDESEWTAQISAHLMVDDAGEPAAVSAIMRDITAQLQAEQERVDLQEQVIRAQRAALRELSTPLIPLTDDVLVMPLIGSIDSARAQQIMEELLNGVAANQASTAILDITGVPVVDTQIANALLQSAQAVSLLGARVMITGIRPEVAQTLVGLGVGLGDIVTHSTLQSGIAFALAARGSRLGKRRG